MLILAGATINFDHYPTPAFIYIPFLDKVTHFGLYSVFGILSARAFWITKFTSSITALTLGYSLLIEVIHLFIPYRAFEWLDLFANISGTLCGILLFIMIQIIFFNSDN
jgi:VanZ family protein